MSTTNEELNKLIADLGDLCHESYLGCAQNKAAPDGYEYSYSNEVVNLLDTPEARKLIQDEIIRARIDELENTMGDFDGTVMVKDGNYYLSKTERITELNQLLNGSVIYCDTCGGSQSNCPDYDKTPHYVVNQQLTKRCPYPNCYGDHNEIDHINAGQGNWENGSNG